MPNVESKVSGFSGILSKAGFTSFPSVQKYSFADKFCELHAKVQVYLAFYVNKSARREYTIIIKASM